MEAKLKAMLRSRRFWLAAAGVAFVANDQFGFGLDRETVNHVVLLIGAWIVGDSLRVTE